MYSCLHKCFLCASERYHVHLNAHTLWENYAGVCGRWAWAQAGIRTTVSKVYKMSFLFAGGISTWWSNRNNSVRLGEDTWCSLCMRDKPCSCWLILGPGQGLIVPVPFLVRVTPLFNDQKQFSMVCAAVIPFPHPLEEVSSLLFRLMLFPGIERTVEIHCWE